MKYVEVADNIKRLLEKLPPQDKFIYELLLAYGTPRATVARLKSGQLNLAQNADEVLLKNKVWFKPVESDLFAAIETLKIAKGTKTNKPRFLIVTNFKQLLAVDIKTTDTLDIELSELETNFDFFLPWAGMEKTKLSNENPADIKAAEKMARLFDAIKQDNPDYMRENAHSMNVFLGRLLFCLFAEDTGIFPENAVSNAIASHTAVDGSDLDTFFKTLFDLLDSNGRDGIPEHLKCFPYVNGGLFRDHFDIPTFSAKSRRMIIASGELNWSEINPDIFGSMFQAVIDPEERHNLGQHYTSVTNIMKVIEPLFLNDFKADFDKAKEKKSGKKQALNRLLNRISKVKIFDPACGSGNFLIIAYKELRRLEMEVFRELQTLEGTGTLPLSEMKVGQFYGIEIADFACETAILALWLAEHQMNLESKKVFGQAPVSLPLKEGANIVCGNATRINWETVCHNNDDEIYVLGNPPYLGSKVQSLGHKDDMRYVFEGYKKYKDLDYITCWFFKASEYVRGINAKYAFVSTNSICQGTQVATFWSIIFSFDLEIDFAHQSFKWTNYAKGNAGVTCIVIGMRNESPSQPKFLFEGKTRRQVNTISAYLTAGANVLVGRRSKPLTAVPKMDMGNMPFDGGNLILSTREKDELILNNPSAECIVRKLLGSSEFIRGNMRWCLWIHDEDLSFANTLLDVRKRIESVEEMRLSSSDKGTRKLAEKPHQFREMREAKKQLMIVPRVSSERREYIPIGFLTPENTISDAQVIYDPEPYLFGLLSSKMHMVWVRITCGRMKTDFRYSSSVSYNTFPIPDLTQKQKQTITMHVFEVLEEREKNPEKTMAQLYDPDKMPDGLRKAHHQLDLAVDRLYRSKPFATDEERLEHLFKLYEEMIAKEKSGS